MTKVDDKTSVDEKILTLLRQNEGMTAEEISSAIGLGWDTAVSLLSNMCQAKQVKCVPRSHTAHGLRAEY